MENFLCKSCQKILPIEQRSIKERAPKLKYRNICKPCFNTRQKERYNKYKTRTPIKDGIIKTANTNKWIKNKYPTANAWQISKYHSLKRSAAKRKILFNLSPEDLPNTPNGICKYLNIPLTFKNFSVDRIDNSKGYTKDNIQFISMKANSMKNSASNAQLIEFAKNILKYHTEPSGEQ